MSLSAISRLNDIRSAVEQHWDIIVIGGGITGAGIALEASCRGMKVLLLEQYDFASGTSSKSTKLIHGGLRYLKQLEFGLVRTVGRERAVIHKLAPHLVIPTRMVLPITEGGTLGKYSTSMALFVYDRLAGVKKHERYQMLTPQALHQMEPLLRSDNVKGGAVYIEYRTDDARLTMAVLKSAHEKGAACFNYLKVTGFSQNNNHINGVEALDLLNNTKHSFNTKLVINAAGPWVDDVRTLEELPHGKRLHLTKGIHIVIPASKFPLEHAIYFDVATDDRMIFAIPRGEVVYVGTTDTNYRDSKEHILIDNADIDYLLSAIADMFPSIQLTRRDVDSGWAGLRPLIHEEGKSPSELSRKDEIFVSKQGMISIAGGKLTGYRKMAEKAVRKAVDLLRKRDGLQFPKANTAQLLLQGSHFSTSIDKYIALRAGEAKQAGISAEQVSRLVFTYGTDAAEILDDVFAHIQRLQDPQQALLFAEVRYAIQNEMVTGVSDFLIRRTGSLYFNKRFATENYRLIAEIIADELQMDASDAKLQLQWFEAVLEELKFS